MGKVKGLAMMSFYLTNFAVGWYRRIGVKGHDRNGRIEFW